MTGRTAFRGTLVTSLWTLLSRVLGFVRDCIMAVTVGVSPESGAFNYAWIVPNLFRDLLGEGAASAAIQPALARERLSRGPEAEARLFARFHGFLAACLVGVLVLSEAGMALALWRWGDDLSAAWRETLVLSLIILPYLVPICLTALYAAPQNLAGMYHLPALAPVLLNVVWIGVLAALTLLPDHPSYRSMALLCLGLLAGGVVQWGLQLPGLRRLGMPLRPELRPGDGTVLRTFRDFLPALLGVAVFQINLAVDQILVRTMVDPSANTYAYHGNRLLQLPLAVLGIAAVTGTAPLFARLSAEGRYGELTQALRRTVEMTLLLTFLSAAGLYVLAVPVIRVLFEHGRFGAENTVILAATVRAYLWGLPAATVAGLLTRVRQSRGDFRGPALAACVIVPLNLVLDVLLLPVLGVPGAAYATSAALTVQALLLAVGLRGLEIGAPLAWSRMPRLLAPAALCGAAAYGASRGLGAAAATPWGLGACIAAGAAAGAVATAWLLPEDFRELVRALRRRR